MEYRQPVVIHRSDALKIVSKTDKPGRYLMFNFHIAMPNGSCTLQVKRLEKGGESISCKLSINEFIATLNKFKETILNDPEPNGKQIVVGTGYLKGIGEDQIYHRGNDLRMGASKEGEFWLGIFDTQSNEPAPPMVVYLVKEPLLKIIRLPDNEQISKQDIAKELLRGYIANCIAFINSVYAKDGTATELSDNKPTASNKTTSNFKGDVFEF